MLWMQRGRRERLDTAGAGGAEVGKDAAGVTVASARKHAGTITSRMRERELSFFGSQRGRREGPPDGADKRARQGHSAVPGTIRQGLVAARMTIYESLGQSRWFSAAARDVGERATIIVALVNQRRADDEHFAALSNSSTLPTRLWGGLTCPPYSAMAHDAGQRARSVICDHRAAPGGGSGHGRGAVKTAAGNGRRRWQRQHLTAPATPSTGAAIAAQRPHLTRE